MPSFSTVADSQAWESQESNPGKPTLNGKQCFMDIPGCTCVQTAMSLVADWRKESNPISDQTVSESSDSEEMSMSITSNQVETNSGRNSVDTFDEGTKVKVTIEGDVISDANGVIAVKEKVSGRRHWLYRAGITTVEGAEQELIPGKAYVDADGDVLLRLEGQGDHVWVDAYGSFCRDDFATRPVRLLT